MKTLESVYGGEYKNTISNAYLPTINNSLFDIQYRNSSGAPTLYNRGIVTIQSFSQCSVYCKNAIIQSEMPFKFNAIERYTAYNGNVYIMMIQIPDI